MAQKHHIRLKEHLLLYSCAYACYPAKAVFEREHLFERCAHSRQPLSRREFKLLWFLLGQSRTQRELTGNPTSTVIPLPIDMHLQLKGFVSSSSDGIFPFLTTGIIRGNSSRTFSGRWKFPDSNAS